MEQLIYKPILQPNGTFSLTITIPINQPPLNGVELCDWDGFIGIKKSEYQFWYQMVEKANDDVILYYCASDDAETHEDIIEFIETNVTYPLEYQHYEVKSLRHLLSNGSLGQAIVQTKMALESQKTK